MSKVNELGVSKKELEDGFAFKNGMIVDKMDEVLKFLHKDHDIIMITGTSRNYTDSFLKRFDILHLFEEIFAIPASISDEGKV